MVDLYLRLPPDNPDAEERFPTEVVMAELEDGCEAGMTETSRSSAAAAATASVDWRLLPSLKEEAKGLVGVEVRFNDILDSLNRRQFAVRDLILLFIWFI